MIKPKFICLECGSKKTVWKGDCVYCCNCEEVVRAAKRPMTELGHKISRMWEYLFHPERYPNGVY